MRWFYLFNNFTDENGHHLSIKLVRRILKTHQIIFQQDQNKHSLFIFRNIN